jgi:Mycothiol maleylpyruvate isomerase N-terminal domain
MTRDLFLTCARSSHELLSSPEVASKWTEPSALRHWSVKGLAGHLARATISVERYLDAPPPDGEPLSPAQYFAAALEGDRDVTSALHTDVRDRGDEAAAVGHAAVVADHAAALERLIVRLSEEPQDRRVAVFKGLVMNLDQYLVTRLVELVVHMDDLAVSVSVPTPPVPPEAYELAIDALVNLARLQNGDAAVLTALARAERDDIDALHPL